MHHPVEVNSDIIKIINCMPMLTNEVLLIYNHPLIANATTIMEHVNSFEKYSKYTIRKINTEFGFPRGLKKIVFSAIIIHYSAYNWTTEDKSYHKCLPKKFWDYIKQSRNSLKIAFFQDEMHNCLKRFELINELNIDIVNSLLDSQYFDQVYYSKTKVKLVYSSLTGYVSDELREKSLIFSKNFSTREVDVGYRARPLPYYLGRGAQEKTQIAIGFIKNCINNSMSFDIKTAESDRIYGDDWLKYISNCKFMLGVESGTSIFDLDGTVQNLLDQYLAINPNANFDEVYESILSPYEDKINYRTISPRLFECAAMKTCMILFKGSYQGILLPNVHYIPLEKDFSNINEVLIKINNLTFVNELLERAYEDLIKNNKYHYSSFVGEFDVTIGSFIKNKYDNEISNKITSLLNMDYAYRMIIARLKRRLIIFPGRNLIKRIYFKLTKKGNTQCAE